MSGKRSNAYMKTEKSNLFFNLLILAGVIVSCISMFAGGFFLRGLIEKERDSKRNIPTPTTPASTTQYLAPNTYYDDSLIMVAKNDPHEAIVVSASRSESNRKMLQTTRMSYYDGKSWQRKVVYGTSGNAGIVPDAIIQSWSIDIDPSRVLKQSSTGALSFNSTNVTFKTGTLMNEMGIRSLPGYTKFMSAGQGSFTIDGASKEAYVLYERIYSLNEKDIQFYDTPLGVTTYWLAFWDEDGTFYHLDKSEVAKPTAIYQTHQFGLLRKADGTVTKSFDVSGSRDNDTAPRQFTFQINAPLNVTADVKVISSLNKATIPNSVWLMNNVTGTIKNDGVEKKGFGLVEIVRDSP